MVNVMNVFQPSLPRFSHSFTPQNGVFWEDKNLFQRSDGIRGVQHSHCSTVPNFAAEFVTRVSARPSRWWFFSLSTSTSLGSMWWKWTKMGQRTPANQDVSRLSPSRRRNSSPSQPIRTPTYGDFLFGLGGYSTHAHFTHVHFLLSSFPQ